tara:strand:- start:3 stop:629 length:627 start_codon:yes stop_codon:yes gene_type:complete
MNGAHDLGGMQCYGSIPIEEDEPIFHDEWEKRVFAATMVSFGALGSIDAFRHAIERMGAERYLSTTYYEHWLAALEMRIEETKLHSKGKSDTPLTSEDVDVIVPTGGNYFRGGVNSEIRFAIGDRVRAKNINPAGHTRLPRYIRGREGEIVTNRGNFVFPDTVAHDLGESPQPLYSVRFESAELWGGEEEGRDAVYIDLWDSYLEKIE